jgi:undecaprenyl-diphosphatase
MQPFATPSLWDTRTCLAFNHLSRSRAWGRFFAVISRLGDGVFWYCLMGLLPLADGWAGLGHSLRLAVTGALGTAIYLGLKKGIRRARPCDCHEVHRTVEPLDRFSFPSGHTLHAVAFSLMICQTYPWLWPLLLPFTILVACSRLVLGLHYPTDVLWGATIGSLLAIISNSLASACC